MMLYQYFRIIARYVRRVCTATFGAYSGFGYGEILWRDTGEHTPDVVIWTEASVAFGRKLCLKIRIEQRFLTYWVRVILKMV